MDKIKITQKEFDELYAIDKDIETTDTSQQEFDEEEEEHAAVDHTEGKEEIFLTPEEELHDDKLEETLGWEPVEE